MTVCHIVCYFYSKDHGVGHGNRAGIAVSCAWGPGMVHPYGQPQVAANLCALHERVLFCLTVQCTSPEW